MHLRANAFVPYRRESAEKQLAEENKSLLEQLDTSVLMMMLSMMNMMLLLLLMIMTDDDDDTGDDDDRCLGIYNWIAVGCQQYSHVPVPYDHILVPFTRCNIVCYHACIL